MGFLKLGVGRRALHVRLIIRGGARPWRGSRVTDLYAVGSFNPDHDAVMRIGVGLHPRA